MNHSRDTNTEFGSLMQYDQFYKYQKENTTISEMNEAPIRFSPTYKFNLGTTNYDISQRIPSWCDRIFYKRNSNTIPLAYNKCLLCLSDHQPIYGVYKIQVETIDQEKKQLILDQILKEKNLENNKKNASSQNEQNANASGNINLNDYVEKFF